jgi:hypothetical protein
MFSRSPSAEDILCEAQYGIPTERARRRMSPLQLADILTSPALDDTARKLIEHELNVRIAQIQSRAAYWAAVAATASTLLGIAIGWYLNKLTPPPLAVVNCQCDRTSEKTSKASSSEYTSPTTIVSKEIQPSSKGSATQNEGSNTKP